MGVLRARDARKPGLVQGAYLLERENINAGHAVVRSVGDRLRAAATERGRALRVEAAGHHLARALRSWRRRCATPCRRTSATSAAWSRRSMTSATRDATLASGGDEPELESVDLHAPVEVPAVAAPLAEHNGIDSNGHEANGHDSNGHEANGARSEPRPAALAWTAPERASTPPAAVPVVASDEAVIDLAAIEAAVSGRSTGFRARAGARTCAGRGARGRRCAGPGASGRRPRRAARVTRAGRLAVDADVRDPAGECGAVRGAGRSDGTPARPWRTPSANRLGAGEPP